MVLIISVLSSNGIVAFFGIVLTHLEYSKDSAVLVTQSMTSLISESMLLCSIAGYDMLLHVTSPLDNIKASQETTLLVLIFPIKSE